MENKSQMTYKEMLAEKDNLQKALSVLKIKISTANSKDQKKLLVEKYDEMENALKTLQNQINTIEKSVKALSETEPGQE